MEMSPQVDSVSGLGTSVYPAVLWGTLKRARHFWSAVLSSDYVDSTGALARVVRDSVMFEQHNK